MTGARCVRYFVFAACVGGQGAALEAQGDPDFPVFTMGFDGPCGEAIHLPPDFPYDDGTGGLDLFFDQRAFMDTGEEVPNDRPGFTWDVTLTTADNPTDTGVDGWSFGIGVQGPAAITDITTNGTPGCHVGRRPECISWAGFEISELTGSPLRLPDGRVVDRAGPHQVQNAGAVCAIVLSQLRPITLPPEGTEAIAKLRVLATAPANPGEQAMMRLFFAERQGSLSPTPTIVTFLGRTFRDGSGLLVEDCEVVINPGPIDPRPADCNGNGVEDREEIANGDKEDCNRNDIPDECDLLPQFALSGAAPRPVGDFPWEVAAADLNGDGFYDMAVANESANSVTVLENLGSEAGTSFRTTEYNDVGLRPRAVAPGDIDRDGYTDLVVANAESNDLRLLMNSRNEEILSFQTGDPISTGGRTSMALAVVDLDGDGDLDIAVGNCDSGDVSVLKNDGSASFAPPRTYETGECPDAIAAADFNLDGAPDLATSNELSGDVSVLLNDMSGSFQPQPEFGAGTFPFDVKTADLNGDDAMDLVVVNADSDDISVFTNRGLEEGGVWAGFQWQASYPLPRFPVSVTPADLNGDGATDLSVAILSINLLYVLVNAGDGTFPQDLWTVRRVGDRPRTVASGDFNGDGQIDIVTADQDDDSVSILLNSPEPRSRDIDENGTPDECDPDCNSNEIPDPFEIANGIASDCNRNGAPDACDLGILGFSPPFTLPAELPTEGVTAADFDGDGHLDLAAANFGSDNVTVFLNAGGARFPERVEYLSGSGSTDVASGDLNADGAPDLAVAAQLEDSAAVLMNNGDGTFAPRTRYTVGAQPLSVVLAHLNRDEHLDLVTANFGSDDIYILVNDGEGTFSRGASLSTRDTGPAGPASIAAADLDADGAVDLAVTNGTAGNLSLFRNNGFGTLQRILGTPATLGPAPLFVSASDLDDDGLPDLAVANSALLGGSSSVMVLWNGGNFSFSEKVTLNAGFESTAVRVADIDGDDRPDLAVSNQGSSNVSVLPNNGNREFASVRNFDLGGAPYKLFAADLDGDGRADIATANNEGTVSVLLNRSSPVSEPDCNANGISDSCDIAAATAENGDGDCNDNSIPDDCDIEDGTLQDENGDGLPEPCFPIDGGYQLPSDCNSDSTLDLSDGICLLSYLFLGGRSLPCGGGAANVSLLDANGDLAIDLSDVVRVFGFLFLGAPPPGPGTECVRIPRCPDTCEP